jgi:GNAT superfamily N-acetyltransferase
MEEYYAYDGLPFERDRAAAACGVLFGDPDGAALWFLEDAGEIAGYLVLTFGYSLEYGGRDAFVDEIYLRESHRGRGLGARAIAFAEGECRRRGVRALHLEVARENGNARSFYERMQFVDQERVLLTKRIR